MIPGQLYHGGVDGLRPGDILTPGHGRKTHDGCPWCEARERGEAHQGIDGPSQVHGIYTTPHRLYAKHHASLYGRGDVYQVEPVGDVRRSVEDSIETWVCDQARVAAVIHRAVLLTMKERRRLFRDWGAADIAHRLRAPESSR